MLVIRGRWTWSKAPRHEQINKFYKMKSGRRYAKPVSNLVLTPSGLRKSDNLAQPGARIYSEFYKSSLQILPFCSANLNSPLNPHSFLKQSHVLFCLRRPQPFCFGICQSLCAFFLSSVSTSTYDSHRHIDNSTGWLNYMDWGSTEHCQLAGWWTTTLSSSVRSRYGIHLRW